MTNTTEYHYTESGLSGVILRGLPVEVTRDGEEVVTIANINLLHRVLVGAVASKASGLRPDEIRFLRTELEKTQAEFAALVGRDVQAVGRWERGENPIDKAAEIVIRTRALEYAGPERSLSIEEIAKLTSAFDTGQPLVINAGDPRNYHVVSEPGELAPATSRSLAEWRRDALKAGPGRPPLRQEPPAKLRVVKGEGSAQRREAVRAKSRQASATSGHPGSPWRFAARSPLSASLRAAAASERTDRSAVRPVARAGDAAVGAIPSESHVLNCGQGIFRFLDCGGVEYVEFADDVTPTTLRLAETSYALQPAAEWPGLFTVVGLTPQHAADFAIDCEEVPGSTLATWE